MKLFFWRKSKNIIIILFLAFLLTGCTFQARELEQEVQSQKQTGEETKEEKKDPAEMSLEELEEELESMKDIEIEEDLDALDEEL